MVPSKKSPNPEQMRELEALLERDPASARFSELADAYIRMGRFQDAIQLCQRGLGHHRRDARGYLSLGRALFGMGRLAVASEALERAIGFAPRDSEAYRLLGEVLVRRGLVDEAVKILEAAVERGSDDPHIERLLARANAALDAEQTRVTGAPKGMGNQAIAGTIGGTAQTDLGTLAGETAGPGESDEDILQGLARGRADDEQLALSAFPDVVGEGVAKPKSREWRAVGEQWGQLLDAQADVRLLTDPDVPVGQPMDFEPPPLSDPVAEGMPPLPEETRELALPQARPEDLEGAEGEVPEPPSPEAEAADTLDMAIPAPVVEGSFEPPPLDSWAKQDFHELEAATKSPSGDVRAAERHFEESLLRDLAEGEVRSPSEVTAERRLDGSATYTEQTAAGRGGGRKFRWVALVLLLVAALGVGGFWAGKTYKRKKASAEVARLLERGIVRGTRSALDEARRALKDVTGAAPGERQAALRLLRALGALWHGGQTPTAATSTAAQAGWLDGAARAAAILSTGGTKGARKALGSEPAEGAPVRWLHALLGAILAEREGRYDEVVERVGAALSRAPKATAALLMRGRAWLTLGWYEQAEDDFRAVLVEAPKSLWARVGLRGALARRGKEAAEPLPKISQSSLRSDPELAAMADLTRAELSDAAGASLLEASAKKLPSTVLVLTYASRALAEACQFGRAERKIEQLRIAYPRLAALINQLRGELALARGLDYRAASLLGAKVASVAQLRLRAWAQLLNGRPERVGALLAGDRSDAGRPLHLLAGALRLLAEDPLSKTGRKPAVGALESLAEHSFQARIGLALVLARMRQGGRALAALEKGTFRLAAQQARRLTLEGTLRAQNDPAKALSSLRKARQICRGYAPALFISGQIRLEADDVVQASRLFALTRKAGLVTPPLREAEARAELALGRVELAEKVLADKAIVGEGAALLAAELALSRGKAKRAEALIRELQPSLRRMKLSAGVAEARRRGRARLRVLDQARGRYPKNLWVMVALGVDLASAKRPAKQAKGRALLARAVQIASRRELGRAMGGRAALALARIAQRERKLPLALEHLAAAEKLDATSSLVFRRRATVLLASKRRAGARRALQQATKLAPRDGIAHLRLGQVCAALRDRKCAKQALKTAMELAPRGPIGKRAARELARLR